MADEKAPGYPEAQQPPPYNEPPPQGYLPPPQGYPPPPQGYPPPQVQPAPQAGYVQPANQTVVVTTVSAPGAIYRDVPVMVQCPNCQNQVTSICIFENGLLVWIVVLILLFVFQLWLGCCLIPLCINAIKDVRHLCPVCKYQLGIYKRI